LTSSSAQGRGPWDLHYLDQLRFAQLEAKDSVKNPILIRHPRARPKASTLHRPIDRRRVAAHARHQPRSGPIYAASRSMKTTRVGGGHPHTCARHAAAASATARRFSRICGTTLVEDDDGLPAAGIKPFSARSGDFNECGCCERSFRNAFLMGFVGRRTLHRAEVPIANRVFSVPRRDPAEVAFAQKKIVDAMCPDGTGGGDDLMAKCRTMPHVNGQSAAARGLEKVVGGQK